MAVNYIAWQRPFKRLNERPIILLGFLTFVTGAYILWQAAEQWFDQPLPASTVAARQLQVDSAGNASLQERLKQYRRDLGDGR